MELPEFNGLPARLIATNDRCLRIKAACDTFGHTQLEKSEKFSLLARRIVPAVNRLRRPQNATHRDFGSERTVRRIDQYNANGGQRLAFAAAVKPRARVLKRVATERQASTDSQRENKSSHSGRTHRMSYPKTLRPAVN